MKNSDIWGNYEYTRKMIRVKDGSIYENPFLCDAESSFETFIRTGSVIIPNHSLGFSYISLPSFSNNSSVVEDEGIRNNEAFRKYLKEQEADFVYQLRVTDFENVYMPDVVEFVKEFPDDFREITMVWISGLYNDNLQDERFLCQLLKFLQYFSYEEMSPMNDFIIDRGLHSNFLSVQSVAISLLGYWADENALRILSNTEAPTHPYLKLKFQTLKQSLSHVLNPKNR